MFEYIGNIRLDLNYAMENDVCTDDPILDEVLRIVQTEDERSFSRIIEQKRDGRMLYHISLQRQNIVAGLPITSGQTVLEIGSECGAVTGKLAEMAKSVTCIEASKKKSVINAYRNQKHENIEILVGDFTEIMENLDQQFDVITMIGCFSYMQEFMKGDNPYQKLMQILNTHLKSNGKIVIATENKYGLRYWAGGREEHTHEFFDGISNYPENNGVRTFAKDSIKKLIEDAGLQVADFYYPYPDYLYTRCIYSDEYLPDKGTLTNNYNNYEDSRMLLFNEAQVYDSLIEDKLFPLFSNSFLIICGRKE